MFTPTLILTPGGPRVAPDTPTSGGGVTPRPLRARDVQVTLLGRRAAQALVEDWHYAHRAGNITHGYGLCLRDCGSVLAVAIYNPPALGAAKFMARGSGAGHQGVIALTRLAFHPEVGANAGSLLLGASLRALPERWRVVTTYADEARGVVGVTYQATNLEYLGVSAPRAVWYREGCQVSVLRGGRTLTHAEMLAEGCELRGHARMHRYRFVRGDHEGRRNPQTYPKPGLYARPARVPRAA